MKQYNLKNPIRQSGMTLIELTVVLLVLIGLAGMLLP
jgi:prepilin-type N-terminal cleavage/methylation domain-containing protein